MVVDEDDVAGGFVKGNAEDVARVGDGAVFGAHADEFYVEYFAGFAKGESPKVFLHKVDFSFLLVKNTLDDLPDISGVLDVDVLCIFYIYFHKLTWLISFTMRGCY